MNDEGHGPQSFAGRAFVMHPDSSGCTEWLYRVVALTGHPESLQREGADAIDHHPFDRGLLMRMTSRIFIFTAHAHAH